MRTPKGRVAWMWVAVGICSCIPTTPTGDWVIYPGHTAGNSSGSSPGVLVVGDSLVDFDDVQSMADTIRFWAGTDAFVAGAPGATVAHYNSASLMQGSNISTLQDYENFFGEIRVTVIALGSNDARIITAEQGSSTAYTVSEYADQLSISINAGLSHSHCVVLVNVADHWAPVASSDVVNQINYLIALQNSVPAHIFVADWHGFSQGHEDWFAAPGNIHHSAAGAAQYRNFITNAVISALQSGC